MATPIAAVVLASPSRKSVRLNTYVSTEKEGQKKGDRFVAQSGVNGCIPEFAERQFRDNRKRWGKNGERTVMRSGRKFVEGQFVQAYHVIQSFARDDVGKLDPTNPDDWETAHELGVALARRVAGKGRMATVTTQIDGKSGCLHNHIVIDSIDKLTGRSFDSANVKHKLLAATNDEVLKDAGFEQVNTLTNGAEKIEKSELRALAKHVAWQADPTSSPEPFSVAVMKDRVFDAMNYPETVDWDSFVDLCEKMGVEVRRSTARDGRGISYRMLRLDQSGDHFLPATRGDVRRASKLGTRFTMDAVEATLERNLDRRRDFQQRHQATTSQPTTTVPHRDEDRTSFAAASEMPAPESAPLHRNVIDEDAYQSIFGTLNDQMEADREARKPDVLAEIRRVQLAPEIEDEKPAEAARSARETEPAPEPIETVSEPQESAQGTSSAAASDMPFRSLLRGVRLRDPKRQQLIDAMASFDEQAVASLEAGEGFPGADVPAGIGRRFLDDYGEKLEPRVLRFLEQRQKKSDAASELFDKYAGRKDPLAKMRREDVSRMREEVKAGNYDFDEQNLGRGGVVKKSDDKPQKDNKDGPSLV